MIDIFDSILNDSNILIGDEGVIPIPTKRKQLNCSDLALEAWRNTENKLLHWRGTDGKVWAEWGTEKDNHNKDGPEELEPYIKAVAELPSLVFNHLTQILMSADGEKRIFNKFLPIYQTKSQWLRFHLLHYRQALLELKFSSKKHQERQAIVSKKLYELIQDIWVRAEVYHDDLCQWVLNFDSPAHLWFCIESDWCKYDMERKMIPGGTSEISGKHNLYQQERRTFNDMENLQKVEIVFDGDRETELILPAKALGITILKVGKEKTAWTTRGKFQKYMESRKSHASYISRNKELKEFCLDEDEELRLVGQGQQLTKTRNRKGKGFGL